MNLPQYHQTVMPYLILNEAEAFISFTQTAFDAELTPNMLSYRQDGTGIQHAEIRIQESTIMFCSASAQYPQQNAGLFIYVENADQTYQKALQSGATIIMELSDQSYGRTCGVSDTFGNIWWITSLLPQSQPALMSSSF